MDNMNTASAIDIEAAPVSGIRYETLVAVVLLVLGTMQALLLVFLGKMVGAALAMLLTLTIGTATIVMTRRRQGSQSGDSVIGWRTLFICLCVSLLVLVAGGEGRFFYANTDWQVRNAVLFDLVRYPWPFAYQNGDQIDILRAPLGMYLAPAILGKIGGFRIAELAVLAQNAFLFGAILSLGSLLYKSARSRWLALGVFLGFSGMDVVGQLLTSRPIHLHLEQWAGIQFSAHLTQAFWVPQHALAGWLFAVAYLLWCERRIPPWLPLAIVPLSALLSPLAMIGMLPFAAHMGCNLALRSQLHVRDFVLPAVAVGASSGSLLYLTAGSTSVGSRPMLPTVSVYISFIMLEVGIYFFALWQLRGQLRFGTTTGLIVLLVLLFAPLIQVGQSVDFVMRASIPALAILSLMVADIFAAPMSADDKSGKSAKIWAALAFSVGLATPIGEAARGILWPPAPEQRCGYLGVVPNGYATYVTPLETLPDPVRPDVVKVVVSREPDHCWAGPWPNAVTGKES